MTIQYKKKKKNINEHRAVQLLIQFKLSQSFISYTCTYNIQSNRIQIQYKDNWL